MADHASSINLSAGQKLKLSMCRSPQVSQDRCLKLMTLERLAMASTDNMALQQSSHSFQKQIWSERVIKWYYDVLDHLDLSRDIAYISMNILDRYVAANAREMMGSLEYGEAAIASLFIAVKISRLSELPMERLISISRSQVSTEAALARVQKILKTLTWEHPILTPGIFAKTILSMFRNEFSSEKMMDIIEHVLYLVELALCDRHHFVGTPASQIAFAAISLAIHPSSGPSSCKLDEKTFASALHTIHQKTGMDYASMESKILCSHLLSTFIASAESNRNCCPHENSTTTTATAKVAIIIEEDDDS